jgi:hypothetical protein
VLVWRHRLLPLGLPSALRATTSSPRSSNSSSTMQHPRLSTSPPAYSSPTASFLTSRWLATPRCPHNDCVFNGTSPSLSSALGMAGEELGFGAWPVPKDSPFWLVWGHLMGETRVKAVGSLWCKKEWLYSAKTCTLCFFYNFLLLLMKWHEGEPSHSSKVVVLWSWGYEFKSLKQPLAEILENAAYVRLKVIGSFPRPYANGSYVQRAALLMKWHAVLLRVQKKYCLSAFGLLVDTTTCKGTNNLLSYQ